jgi:hypothetical protein
LVPRFYGAIADPYYKPLAKDLLGLSYNLYDDDYNSYPRYPYYYGRYYSYNPAYSW